MFYISGIQGTQTPYTPVTNVLLPTTAPVTAIDNQQTADTIDSTDVTSTTDTTEVTTSSETTDASTDTSANEIVDKAPTFQSTTIGISTAGAGMAQRGSKSAGQNSSNNSHQQGYSTVEALESSNPVDQKNVDEAPLKFHTPHKNPYAHLDDPAPQREPAITAAQIMSSPVMSLSVNDTVETAWKLFHQKHFRHVPILSEEKKLVGIVSDRDFLSLGLDHIGNELTKAQQLASPIKNIMRTNILTTRPSTEIRIIAKVLFTENISAIPIVDEKESLIGILTTNDILKTLINRAPLTLWT